MLPGWQIISGNPRIFIENKGQFSIPGSKEQVLFRAGDERSSVFFTRNGLTYTFLKQWKETEREEKKSFKNSEEYKRHEEEERKMNFSSEKISINWKNSNPDVVVSAEEPTADYHSYSYYSSNGEIKNINFIKSFRKLTYHNLYPNIDVEYVFHPVEGIKYSLIVRPGGDLAKVELVYTENIKLNTDGSLSLNTKSAKITERPPVTFYKGDQERKINSAFLKKGNTVSFQVAAYDKTQTIVIDPWVQLPTFGNTTWNCVWECEKDGAGNVYALGGGASQSANSQMQIKKYNPSGVLQWTYNTPYDTSNCWLGTFVTDNAGNSYVTRGSVSGMQKINSSGTLVWNNNGGGGSIGNSDEYWNIAFNCDQTKLIVGGTSGAFALPPVLEAAIFDIDVNNGSVLATKKVAKGPTTTIPPNTQEVRSITASPNGKYYYLTQDTIGYVNQIFSLCPSGSFNGLKINNGIDLGYKCEDYRFDNSGIMALRADSNFLYVNKGNQIQKRSLQTLTVLAAASIPGGALNNVFLGGNNVSNSGIDIDQCGNIYVGSKNQVVKFDPGLNIISTYTTAYNVYDLHVMQSGDIVVCGSTGNSSSTGSRTGYIQVISAAACSPITLNCCNTGVCVPGSFCQNDPALNLTAATSGGVWSGTGITNSTLGTFNPSIAGPGTHIVTYTLPCGSESISVTVLSCQALNVCAEANGNITVNGSGTFTWYQQTTTTPCVSGVGFYCGPFTVAGTPTTTWSSFANGSTVNPSTGSYPMYVINNNGDSAYISTFASLPACSACSINANISNSSNVSCNGGNNGSATVTLTGGTGTITYAWSPSGGNSATATGLTAGNYTCAITAGTCSTTATVSISEPAVVSTATSSIAATCGAANGSATVNATGGTGSLSYLWSVSGQTTSTASNLPAGAYTCTVTDANSCTVTATVVINNLNGPVLNLTSQVNNPCFGDSLGTAQVVVNGGTGVINYNWIPYGGTSSLASGLAAGSYTCTVTDGSNCTSTQTVNITAPSALTNSVSTTPASCGLSDGTASVTVNGGAGGYTYSWQPGSQTGSVANNLSAGIYTITIVDQNNCVVTNTVQVSNPNSPVILASANGPFCEGGAINLAASGGLNYFWSGPNGFISNSQNPQIFPASTVQSGTYSVTGTDANGCVNTATVNVLVTASPVVSVTSSVPTFTVYTGDNITLNANGASTYVWFPGGVTGQQLNINPANEGTFIYCVVGTTAQGCQDSACVNFSVIKMDCGSLFIPNAFSPNGDLSNDELCIYGAQCIEVLQFRIFDRWGEKVFESADPNFCWDGSYQGKMLNSGVFAYYLSATFKNGEKVDFKGNVSLIK